MAVEYRPKRSRAKRVAIAFGGKRVHPCGVGPTIHIRGRMNHKSSGGGGTSKTTREAFDRS